jgi:hypothetical protein
VAAETTSSCAISALERPWASSRSTSSSLARAEVGERAVVARRRHARELLDHAAGPGGRDPQGEQPDGPRITRGQTPRHS